MTKTLSENAKAVLLLTAPLIAGRDNREDALLTPGEYKRLALYLRELGCEPADLISVDASDLIQKCGEVVARDRLENLLARGFKLGPVVDGWYSRSIWIVCSNDDEYPLNLKSRLGFDAPPLLYGCGEMSLLELRGLAVVGSRNADIDALEFSKNVGAQAANSGISIVSGGARGIDQAAMEGASRAGGTVVGVLPDGLFDAVVDRENRSGLMDGTLCLVSPFDPNARFFVGHAMQRNKYIYALSDAALVVSSELGKGGTWSGAKEQLDRFRLGPIYVRQLNQSSPGLDGLREKGASFWPNPRSTDEFLMVFDQDKRSEPSHPNTNLTLF
jgi:DNA processing protein